jgi:hypothetical protein
MARELIVRLTDDLDGSAAVETISFGFRGVDYEIDLSRDNVAELERAFATWIEHSRKLPAGGARAAVGGGRSGARSSRRGTEDLSAMRAWARENGYRVSDRGRISTEIREAFHAAQG